MNIGFIGQGWIGKNYANDFEARGLDVVRYALEEPYCRNKEKIRECDIVFIAVPTPTTKTGFDDSAVYSAVKLVGKGKTAVIKSTITPGTTESIQKLNDDIFVLHSPEFLVELTAAFDAAHPNRNIVGIPIDNKIYRKKAREVLAVLPPATYVKIMSSRDAEFIKYAGNSLLFSKVIFMNLLYDFVEEIGGDWEGIREALIHDPRIGVSHTEPVHKSGRGAGGHCFIKDFETFREMYQEKVRDSLGSKILGALVEKNIQLLTESNKDVALLEGVYGDLSKYRNNTSTREQQP
jgi:nucleotide sugar dehydrogenase